MIPALNQLAGNVFKRDPSAATIFLKIRGLVKRARRAEPLEFSQILTRYTVGTVITVYAIIDPAVETELRQQVSIILMLIIAWVVGTGILLHLLFWPERRVCRRIVSICADAAALSLLIHYGARSAAIFFPVYLWVILGNGFRFGINYMYGSMAANAICFIAMVLTTPFWRQEWQFSAGVFVAIIAIPFYTSSLIKRLRLSMELAKAASKAKTEFLSMISHELRTPLNAILGLAQISRITAESAQESRDAAFTEIAANRLKRMLDTILKFQAAENGDGRVQERCFDVLDMLSEAEAILAPLAWKKKLGFMFRFRTSLPEKIISDPDMIQTIIINLATNAIKYTISGFVFVDISVADATKLRIDVHDSGPGIDTELQSRIFDRFVRHVPQGTEDEGGVGLGLPLCKSLAGMLGGDIGFSSRYGHGSTFWVELPVKCFEHSNSAYTGADQSTEIAAFGLDIFWGSDAAQEFRLLCGHQAGAILEDDQANNPRTNLVLIADPSKMAPEHQERLWHFVNHTAAPPPLIVVGSSEPTTSGISAYASASVSSSSALSPNLIRTVINWHRRHLPRPAGAPQTPANNKTILVADDNTMNRQVTARMLKLDGYEVLEAETGEGAFDLLLTKKVDLALLDVNMPDQDGIEACKAYHSVASREAAAVIVGLTADISEETRSRCLAAGMAEVLTKPLDLEDLRALVTRIKHNDDNNDSEINIISQQSKHQEEVSVLDVERISLLVELFTADIFKNDLLSKFEMETVANVERLKAESSKLRPMEMRAILHAIKSSALTLGAPRLAKLACSLQNLELEPKSFENITSELNAFLSSCRECLDHESIQAAPNSKNVAYERSELR